MVIQLKVHKLDAINPNPMLTFKKRLVAIILLALFSTATMVSCGKQQASTETEEHAEDEHPADSAEHPSDSTAQENEHPADSTDMQ